MALTINDVRLDDPQRVYVIAEAAGSHNQDYATAEALVHAAADVGADAVKFQTFEASDICVDMPLPWGKDPRHDAWLQALDVQDMRALFSKGGLPRDWHKPLKDVAESRGIAFLSTPFSVDAARFLVEEMGVPALKIASGDLTFTPLLEYAASTELPVILSTGGATLKEIESALFTLDDAIPESRLNEMWFYRDVALLHCVSIYPCHDTFANVRAISTLQEHFVCGAFGFSDHTLSYDLVPALAVSCGATVYEKHLRLEDDISSVDAAHSLTPGQFAHMVYTIRQVPMILGHGRKEPHALELHDKAWARRDPSDWLRPTAAARQGAWE